MERNNVEPMNPKPSFHRIKQLKVTGGFLAGLDLSFSDGLNTVIGARGSGKSSEQELIRYALGILPGRDEKDPLRRKIDGLIKNTLDGGRVEVVIETKEGMTYTVSRSQDEDPVLLSEDGTPLPIDALHSQIFSADIYSQNQIESIAETPHYQLDLLDKFRESELRVVDQDLDATVRKLRTNAAAIIPLTSERAQLEAELTQLEAVREKLKSLAKADGQDTEEMNRIHAAKGLRDREIKAIDLARAQLADFKMRISSFVGHYGPQALGVFGDDMRTSVNRLLTGEAISAIQTGIANAEKHINAAVAAISVAESAVEEVRTKLEQAHVAQELEYRKVVEAQVQNQAKSVERAKVEKQHNDLMFKAKRLDDVKTTISKLEKERLRLLGELSEVRDRRFSIRNSVANELNSHLNPTIQVQIEQNADQEDYRKLLESHLKGGGIQQGTVAQKLSSSITPSELGELVRKNEPMLLVKKGNINPDQARKVISELSNPEKLMELEIVEMDDLPRIDLNDNGVYKNSAELSTGQKCTAILPILLFDSVNPLLIDQPEDNLDNRYVYECVVDTVRKVKGGRQLIFVTHNPNIPVLGDAEKVIVLHSDGRSGMVRKVGNVDQCRDEIINLLEGGADAFRLRSERYNGKSS
jgi:energy-coupling factor transporter ATP-binding protein EcfA2